MDDRLTRLRERRRDAEARRRAVTDAAEARGDEHLTEDEDQRFRDLTREIKDYDARIAELTNEARNRATTEGAAAVVRAQGERSETRTWLPGIAEYRDLQAEQRAVGTSGAFIPVLGAATYFDLLRARTAVLAAGPVLLPVDGFGSVKVPKVSASVTVAGIPENTAITPDDPGLDEIELDPKKFGAMTLVAREAVEDSKPELRQVVANSLVRDTAVELDAQLVTGDGQGNNLLGLRNVTGLTAGPDTGTDGTSLTFDLLADTIGAADAANTDPDRLAWIMHSRTFSSVRKLTDTQGRPIVALDPTAGVRPSIFGKPVFVSNSLSVTETVGTSTDCSSILLADMSQVVVAVSRQPELMISEHYAFNADQIAVRVTARYDVGVPQPSGVVLTEGVRP